MTFRHVSHRSISGPAVTAGVAIALCLGSAYGLGVGGVWAAEPALQQHLARRMSIVWSETPLRQALESLSRTQQVAIVLDRRIDPTQRISLSVSDTPLDVVLQAIAEQCRLGVSRLGPVVYLGLPASALRLPAVAALRERDVQRLPSAAGHTLQQTRAMAWGNLAEPRSLLAELGRENGLEIAGLDRVPHDLWPTKDLPPMSLVDRLTLIAGQFDLTFKIASDGRHLALTSMPDDLQEGERLAASHRTANPASAQPAPAKPSAAKQTGQQSSASRESSSKSSADLRQVRIERLAVQEKPLGAVLRQLAERLKLELHIDDKAIATAGISMDQHVSATVNNATIDELLHELLKATGLTFRRTENIVEIRPAK